MSDMQAKAEAALAEKAGALRLWLDRGVERLEAARAAVRADGVDPETIGQLYMRAHDLKGAGGAAGFPTITRIAASLCLLLDDADHAHAEQMGLVDDHIDALKAVLAWNIATEDHPAGQAILAELKRDIEYR